MNYSSSSIFNAICSDYYSSSIKSYYDLISLYNSTNYVSFTDLYYFYIKSVNSVIYSAYSLILFFNIGIILPSEFDAVSPSGSTLD